MSDLLHLPHLHAHDDDDHDDFGGLHRDLRATGGVMGRREVVRLAASFGAGLGALHLLGCGGDSITGTTGTGTTSTTTGGTTTGSTTGTTGTTTGTTGTTTGTTGTTAASCSRIPEETAGPYPADGSNGPSVLSATGVVRSDIRSSFAGLSGTAVGVPLTIELTIVSATTCEVLANRAVYLWHCDRAGLYSLYSSGVTNQNYLRGVQETDANGKVTFTSIYPACYSGRWPHIHFEVYPSLSAATNVRNKVATSQIALPKATNDLVYATAGYEQSVRNAAQVSLATDNVFSDGSALELATVTGSVTSGLKAALTVAVNA